MAVKKSASKKMRQDLKRRLSNRMAKSKIKTEIKKLLSLSKENPIAEVSLKLKGVFSLLDKASRKNLIHRNACARKKSRIILALRKKEINV